MRVDPEGRTGTHFGGCAGDECNVIFQIRQMNVITGQNRENE